MRKEDNDKFWDAIEHLELIETDLYEVKRELENIITNIRHKKSELTDYMLYYETKVKED